MREIEQLVAAREQDQLEVTDWWRTLDLTSLGFELLWNTGVEPAPYLVRPPGARGPVAVPPELEITRVRTPETLAEFEAASFEGFEGVGAHAPGCWHAPASLVRPHASCTAFGGRLARDAGSPSDLDGDGQVVTASAARTNAIWAVASNWLRGPSAVA